MLLSSLSTRSACRAPVAARRSAVAPTRLAAVGKEDVQKVAQELLKQGVSALKNVDKDQVKAAAAAAASTAKSTAATAASTAKSTYNTSAAAIKSCIDAAMGVWSTHDIDGDGKLTIKETVSLLNSPEVAAAVTKATGLEHSTRTEEDIQKWFSRADFDHSGSLSKREFVVLYIGLLAHKAKLGAGGLASALCTALDSDGDGKLGSTELKRLLAGSGLTLLANVANLIPDGKEVDYRALLAKVQ